MMEEKGLKEDRLPNDRLSNLVQVAITDAKGLYAERLIEYVPCSDRYHAPIDYGLDSLYFREGAPDKQCQICLAGAVIAGTLGGNPTEDLGPSSFRAYRSAGLDSYTNDYSEEVKLRTLDYVRSGMLEVAYSLFYDDGLYRQATQKQLDELVRMGGLIAYKHFQGWPEFMMHVESLELLVKAMATFEDTWGLVREAKK